MEQNDRFVTTELVGKLVAGLGWVVVVISVIACLALIAKRDTETKLAGGLVLVVGGVLGILTVAQGQLLQIMVSIERNTRAHLKDVPLIHAAPDESLHDEATGLSIACAKCGRIYPLDFSSNASFCTQCGSPLDFAEAWNDEGSALLDSGRYKEALNAYEKAIQIEPNFTEAWYNKGIIFDKLGRHEEELIAYDRALKLNPTHAEAWLNKGVVLNQLGRHEEALKAHDRALALRPDDADAWFSCACTHALMDKKQEALSDLKRAIELNVAYKEKAKKDEDLKNLWDDEDFRRLVE